MATIPTQQKDKIPFTESYPLGAEKISQALEKVANRDSLSLSFHIRSSRFRQNGPEFLTRRQTVLRCGYNRRVRSIHTPSNLQHYYLEHPIFWQLVVYSVPRQLKHQIGQMLMTEAFPRICDWLNERKELPTSTSEENISFFYNFEKDALEQEVSRK